MILPNMMQLERSDHIENNSYYKARKEERKNERKKETKQTRKKERTHKKQTQKEKQDSTTTTTIITYHEDIPLWGDVRLQKKEVPAQIRWGKLLNTISGYFSFPTIPPYYFKTLHFVEHRLCTRQ